MVNGVRRRKCHLPTTDCMLEESKGNSLVVSFTPRQPQRKVKDFFFLHPFNHGGKQRTFFLCPVNHSGKEMIIFLNPVNHSGKEIILFLHPVNRRGNELIIFFTPSQL